MSSKKNRNKFIAAGTYGCVYRPSLPCGTTREEGGGTVSKVFAKGYNMEKNQEDFEEEINRNQKAKEINTEGAFTLAHVNACEIPSNTLTDAEKESCAESHKPTRKNTFRNFSKGKVPQIVYKDGGFPLGEVWKNNIPLSQFLKDFQNVMQGLVKLNQHRHVHTDIKPGNILYNPIEHRAKLVDFGFLDEESWLYRDALKNPNVLMHAYAYYPPEFKVMFLFIVPELLNTPFASYINEMYRQNGDEISPHTIDRFFLIWPSLVHIFTRYADKRDERAAERIAFVEKVIQNMSLPSLKQKYQRVLKRFHYHTRAQQINAFRESLQSHLQFQDFSFRANKLQQLQKLFVQQRFGAKIDLYSVGVSLLEVLSSYLMPLIIGQRVSSAQEIDIPMHENIVALLYILSGMVHPDPYVRLSAKEASDLYDVFVDTLQTADTSARANKLQKIQQKVEERIPVSTNTANTGSKNSSLRMLRNTRMSTASPMNTNSVRKSPSSSPSPMDIDSVPIRSQNGKEKKKNSKGVSK